ncbi:DUF4915 domain-containing protein [Patescibacteria group bacterium]|nr:DUF4915 domain-containing protein [Patescibacteria group bacterium]
MNHHYVLISFCNNQLSSSGQTICVGIPSDFNEAKIKFAPVYSGFQGFINSITGVSNDQNNIYLLNPGAPNKISVLDNDDFSEKFSQYLPQVIDAHSSIVCNNKLYVVSTGTDEVISYDIEEDKLINPQTFWKASSDGKDSHHINSIININGDFHISAFGPKSGTLHSSAKNGYIQNITKNIMLKEGINQPHTLSERNGKLYYCESSLGYFSSLDERLLHLDGYLRGIAWINDEIVCLTTSIGRTISKSTGQILNPADPGEPSGSCSLTVFNISTKEILLKTDLSNFGPETYDVLFVKSEIDLLKKAKSAFIQERKWSNQIQNELADREKTVQNLNAQLAERDQTIQQLHADVTERDQTIQQLHADVTERDQTIQQLHADVTERDQTIQQLHADVTERDQTKTIQQLHADVTEQEQTIQQLQADLTERDQTKTIQQLHADVTEQEQSIQQLQADVAEREQEVLFYALSKSWRITRPLRKFMKLIRGKRND